MLHQFKNTPEMEVAIWGRIRSIINDKSLDSRGATDIVFAIFKMGREGFKLEDITVEAVLKIIDKPGF